LTPGSNLWICVLNDLKSSSKNKFKNDLDYCVASFVVFPLISFFANSMIWFGFQVPFVTQSTFQFNLTCSPWLNKFGQSLSGSSSPSSWPSLTLSWDVASPVDPGVTLATVATPSSCLTGFRVTPQPSAPSMGKRTALTNLHALQVKLGIT
jgi:hypothetical protein